MDKVKDIWSKNKKAIIIMVTILILFFGYKSFFGNSEDGTDLVLDYVPVGDAYETGLGQSILQTLSALRAIKLDVSVFQNPVFLSLVGHEVATTSVPLGRIDPFAPISQQATGASLLLEE